MKTATQLSMIAAVTALTMLGLTGCDSPGALAPPAANAKSERPGPTDVPQACAASDGGKILIGFVDISEQISFFTQMNTGAEEVAKMAGADIQIISGANDPATQVTGVESLMARKANAIIIDPVNPDALVPAIAKASAAGVPVVSVDGSMGAGSAISAQVGTSNGEGGAELGKALLEIAGNKGKVGVVGALSSSIQLERQKGFIDAVTAGGMTIGTIVDGHNAIDQATNATENLLTSDPDLKYIYATGGPALEGVAAAIKSQNAKDRVQVVGWDLSEVSAEGLREGYMKAIIQQDSFGFGYESAKAAINLACGATDVPETISVPINIVTVKNLDQYAYFLEK